MIKQNVSLKDYTYYGIGGPASYFLEVSSTKDLIAGLREWNEIPESASQKIFIIGGGTNVLASDEGFDGLVIKNSICAIKREGTRISFGSGLPFESAVEFAIQNSLSGFEWAGGLPGSIGGAVRGNAGAFGGETKDNVASVESLNLEDLETKIYANSECQFTYRSSVFKSKLSGQEIILSATFDFVPGNQAEISKAVTEKIKYREDHQPLEYPSAGSTFKNIPLDQVPKEWQERYADKIKTDPFPVMPVAWLLSEAGLKGKRIGNAQFSEKHPNFLVNLGGAKSSDVLSLIQLAQKTVWDKFNTKIETEIIYLQ